MSAPKVSVLVPIFNVEKYLEECLDSIVNQTLEDIEIICINDGSTDGSLEIINKYAQKDNRIIVINKKNSGYGDSMNKGIKKASGEYIGIVESDDFIDPGMFEDLYNLATKHDADVAKSEFFYHYTDLSSQSPQWDPEIGGIYSKENQRLITEHDTKSNIINKDEINRIIDPAIDQHIFYQKPSIWSAIYRREFLSKNGIKFLPTPGASYQDTGFSFKVWSSTNRAVFTKNAYLHYRQDNEASSVNSPGKVFCVNEEYEEIEKFLKAKNLYKKFGPLSQKTKYGAYSWNFYRLSEELDAEFIKAFSNEYKKAEDSGVLDYFYFDVNERRILKEIINNPDMALKRKHAKNKAKISVIIPIYNTEKQLRGCLDSLLNQSLNDIEIICINDGSTDSSPYILDEYFAKDPRVVVRDMGKRGVSAARNHGIAKASAKFLMFCDSDDTYKTDACENLYNAITKNSSDIAIAGIEVTYAKPEIAAKYRHSDDEYYRIKYNGNVEITEDIIKNTDVSPCNKIFRTALQRKYKIWFPNGLWYEDSLFFNEYMLISKNAYYLRDIKTYNYIRRSGSIMSETAEKTPKAIDHITIGIMLFDFMKLHSLLEKHPNLPYHYIDNFYRLAKKYTPESHYPKLHATVRNFIDKNRKDISPTLISKIEKDLPEEYQDSLLKKICIRIFSLSPTYRRQTYIIKMIEEMKKDINISNKEILKQLNNIQRELDK